ncbi:MAG: AgmX/PglI C-terminal domain-containing protein [Deltaproteobacteria bacterium]|nr:AgmX/PglI C-terminal domain-containing protein [Deltaproteobacteria bacterium]
MTRNRPSGGMSALAAILPGVLCLVGSFVAMGGSGQGLDLGRRLTEMGGWGPLVIVAAVVVTPLCSVFVCMSARGRRVPVVLVIGLAVVPWLLGIFGAYVGLVEVTAALVSVSPDMLGPMTAKGVSIAADARVLGAAVSGSLLCGLALAYGFGSLGQRATERRGLLALAGMAAALPAVFLAGRGVLEAGAAGTMAMVGAVAVMFAAGLGGGGAGDDDPDKRNHSGALAVAGVFAAVLALVALASCGATGAMVQAFAALEMAAPDQRMALLARGATEFAPLRMVVLVGGVSALVPVLVLMVAAAFRSVIWAGRVVRVVLVAAIGLVPVVLDLSSAASEDAVIELTSQPLGSHLQGYQPLALATDGGKYVPTPHAFVLVNQIVPWQGEPFTLGDPTSPLERDRLAPLLKGLVEGPAPIVPGVPTIPQDELPDWLVEDPPRKEIDDPAQQMIDDPALTFAVDARVSGSVLRLLIDAARAAGVRQIVLIGVDERSVPTKESRAFFGSMPYFSHLLEPRVIAIDALVEESLPAGCMAHARARSFGTIGAADTVTIQPWPGKAPPPRAASPLVLGPPDDDGYFSGDRAMGGDTVICLMLGADATPSSVFRAAGRAAERGFLPLLATGGIDVSAPAPPVPPAETLLGILAGSGQRGTAPVAGSPMVKGSLPKETIRRVVQRHINQVKFCYEMGLARDSSLAGRVSVKFIISSTGAVQLAAIASSTLGDSDVESCIAQSVRRWKFPQPEGGGIVIVTYPFNFTSADK